MVEFTLGLVLILSLIGGIVDWSMMLFARHMSQNAVREAAREAALLPNPVGSQAALTATYQSVLPSGPLFDEYDDISIQVVPFGGASGVQIQASEVYETAFLRLVGFTTLPVEVSATVYHER